MATEVTIPQMGESIAEATVTRWLVKEGDAVERDQPLLEISTDKVDAEVPSPAAGTVLELRAKEGETLAVDTVVAVIGAAGEEVSEPEGELAEEGEAAPPAAAAGEEREEMEEEAEAEPQPAERRTAVSAGPADADYDLLVIGSGPGGYVAAIRAAQLGMSTALVEKDESYGGTCTLRGCIPTKALLQTAELLDRARGAEAFGVRLGEPELELDKAHAFKRGVVEKNSKGIAYLLKKNGIEGIRGRARLAGPHEVVVESPDGEKRTTARHILIATGSVPRELPIARTDGERILDSDQILELETVPKRLVVLGSGAVGTEFASLFASFGSEVTLVEMLPRILPIEDEEVSRQLEKSLRKRGITCRTGTELASVKESESGLELVVKSGDGEESLQTDLLLVAVGRAPVTADLGLQEQGVELEKDFIRVNRYLQTSVPHIYAIGDVTASPMLAHVASAEGILAAEHMAGRSVRPLDYDKVPSCTYCDPEVASVGLTEAQARERGHEVEVGKFPFSALGKARIIGASEGFVKLVRETRYDEVLGVHIIGPHATDLIAEACVALNLETTNEEIVRTVHAHPTLAEAVAEAAHAAAGAALHL